MRFQVLPDLPVSRCLGGDTVHKGCPSQRHCFCYQGARDCGRSKNSSLSFKKTLLKTVYQEDLRFFKRTEINMLKVDMSGALEGLAGCGNGLIGPRKVWEVWGRATTPIVHS